MLVLAVLATTVSSEMSGLYEISVDDAGYVDVNLTVTGQGSLDMSLPLDVPAPITRKLLYLPAADGVKITKAQHGDASIAYGTNLMTLKEGNGWMFSIDLPALESAQLRISLPKDSLLDESTLPEASRYDKDEDTLHMDVNPRQVTNIAVHYQMLNAGFEDGKIKSKLPLLVVFLILAAALICCLIVLTLIRRNKRQNTKEAKDD